MRLGVAPSGTVTSASSRSEAEFGATSAALRSLIDRGLYPGVQAYVSVGGECVFRAVFGKRTPDDDLDENDSLPLLSVSKCFLATAAALLWERGELDLDAPVSAVLPEYGVHGKSLVTARHLLTHTVGPIGESDWNHNALLGLDVDDAFAAALAAACGSRLDPAIGPGLRSEYSPMWGWIVLAEILRRVDGRPYDEIVRQEILVPLGANLVYGRPEAVVGAAPSCDVFDRQNGAAEFAVHQLVTDAASFRSPGAGLWGSASETAKLFEMLLRGGVTASGRRILAASTVDAITTRQRPPMFENRPIVDVGLGFIMEGRRHGTRFAYFGTECSSSTFGHYGLRSFFAFCDPERALVVSIGGNGFPELLPRQLAWRRVARCIYDELAAGSSDASSSASKV